MKTHDIAKILSALANALRNAPNQTLDELSSGPSRKPQPDAQSIPIALSTLIALSDFDKNQWLFLIKEYNFPIEVRPRDASRDILGKILKHLEQNPEARSKLVQSSNKERSETSPELLRALQFLLKS
jgi:hypothetical protein